MNTVTRWTYAPDPSSPEKVGQARPRVLYDAQGNIVLGVPDVRIHEYGWYPERIRDGLPRYSRGWLEMTMIDTDAGEAYYVPDLPPEPERVARAHQDLEARIGAERNRLVAIATTGIDPPPMEDTITAQLAALMNVVQLLYKDMRGRATPADIETLDIMDKIPGQVRAIEQARAAITEWAKDSLHDIDAIDTFNPANPPKEAPQWPRI